MKYEDLRNFILYDMKPDKSSGEPKNYQPIMILILNQNHGKATKKEIVDALKKANTNRRVTDDSFNIVCKTLRGHKVVEQKGDQYFLLDYETIDKFFGRKAEITKCCYNKIRGLTFTVSPQVTISGPKMKKNSFWLSSGSWKNWEHTINNPPIRWGAKEKERNLWEKLQVNDVVFCSASSKTDRPFTKNGIFMVAKVIRKYVLEKNDGYYPGSLIDDKDFFRYRFELESLKIVEKDEDLLPVVNGLVFRKSLNRITNTGAIRQLTENLDKLWNVKIESDDGFEKLIRKFDQNRKLFRSWWKTDEEREQELHEFTSRFPIDKIPDMKIEDYVFGIPDPQTGKSKEHAFCYMLEHSLPSFGGIRGTPNEKFGIYFNKTKKDYSYNEDQYDSPQTAFEAIKNDIHRILDAGRQLQRDGDWKKLSDVVDQDEGHNITSHIRSKILVTYFPNECVGIHSRSSLSKILEKLGTPSKDLYSKITLMQNEILKIKNSHPIMRKWSNADYGHFLWSAVLKDKEPDDEETEREKVEEVFSANYLLLRHNPPEKRKKVDRKYWDDLFGKEYHFGKTVPNHSKIIPGSKTVWFYTDKDDLYLWGYGDVDQRHTLNNNEFIASMKNFHSFGLDSSAQKCGTSIQKKIKSLKGWNKFNSVIEINKEIYDEIVNSTSKLESFVDQTLSKPSSSEIKAGLEEIKEELLIPDEKIIEIVTSLASGSHVILAGPIGTGKTELARKIPQIFWSKNGGYYSDIFTATADWNTQDVIGGIIPKMDGDKVKYKIQDGCVTESVRKNWDGKIRKYHSEGGNFRGVWTIIDEFNRADIDKAFGQLFTALRTLELKVPTNLYNESHESLKIPKDFRIIGTLNTADKHYLFPLSDALKSRFSFIEVDVPDPTLKDAEIYYAMKNAIASFDGEGFDSIVSLGDKQNIIKRNDKFYAVAYQAYNFLAFIRLFKKLGTAILKMIFQHLLAGAKMSLNLNNVLDNAINSIIIPQLEGLPEMELNLINNLQKNDLGSFFREYNKSRNKRTISKEILEKTLNFLKIPDKDFKDFETTEIKDQNIWNQLKMDESQQKPENKIAINMKQVSRSLDSLIEQSVI